MYRDTSSDFFSTPSLSISDSYSDITTMACSDGGFAILYRATKDGKQFVLKGLKEEYRNNPIYEGLLRKEYDLGYLLEHPHIRRTYGFNHVEGLGSIIVMEYVVGRTLREYLTTESHTIEERRAMILQLCEGLSFAHKHQIIHRDLKPENIIITHNGDHVKIIDFGLSDSDSHVTLKGSAGTRRYAAPELMQGEPVSNYADIYSLGVIIGETFASSRRAKKVMVRCTMFSPAMRYSSVGEVANDLRINNMRWLWVAACALVLVLSYLIYNSTGVMTKREYAEVLIPSAVIDGVSDTVFEQRVTLSNDYYRETNNSYLALMNEKMYKMNCATPEMPDFEKLSRLQIAYCENALDSILGEVKESSLYTAARRNLLSHNNEMFVIMRNSFPALFWLNTEQLYKNATDSLALELRKLQSPRFTDNYAELTYSEQQAEEQRYNKEVQRFKKATVEVWTVAYRKNNNLSPLPPYLLEYYSQE